MNQLTLAKLQEATADRGKAWGSPGLQFRGLELSGESIELLQAFDALDKRVREVVLHAGKTVEAMKKIVRFKEGMKGGSDDFSELKAELGDTVISCALLANELELDLGNIVATKFNQTSRKYDFPQRLETNECLTTQLNDRQFHTLLPLGNESVVSRRMADSIGGKLKALNSTQVPTLDAQDRAPWE